MNIRQRIEAFVKLGELMKSYANDKLQKSDSSLHNSFESAIMKAASANGWFSPGNIKYAIMSLGEMLKIDNLNTWMAMYETDPDSMRNPKEIGVIMAGNIPAVGFHDLLCVLMSGNNILIKPSSDDSVLIRFLTDILIDIKPDFKPCIKFSGDKLKGFDAVIATGSNNTSRYFEYYFGKYPHIIRRNMNGIALMNGDETEAELEGLAEDVFRYYGLGCRNVSALLVPEDYKLEKVTASFSKWDIAGDNNKYHNNYVYNKTLALLNNDTFYDGGFYIMKVSGKIPGPLSVVNVISYKNTEEAKAFIESHLTEIQCVATNEKNVKKAVRFGQTQHPELWDYADDVDTMEFLLSLK